VTSSTVLTLDLGTTSTKAGLWRDAELVEIARAPLATSHPAPDRAEQDPEDWWRSVVAACAELRAAAPEDYSRVSTLVCAAARETFALVDAELAPLGPGILWSDTRAAGQVDALGPAARFRRATGVLAGAGCAAAKIAWVAEHASEELAAARWVLAPRDLVLARLTGRVVTDPTLASRTGWFELDGTPRADAALAARLPPIVASTAVVAAVPSRWTSELALPPATRVVPGAGDRACEVLGTGARSDLPMVSWGTTANVSVPHPGPLTVLPATGQVSRGPDGRFLVEFGLSTAGSALAWFAALTGSTEQDLRAAATSSPPGARGVRALPWLAGARAPHWRDGVAGTLDGLRPHHDRGDIARALIEGVALDVSRSLDALDAPGTELVLAGGGAVDPTWRAALAATTGRVVLGRRHADAATVGARLLAAMATGERVTVDAVNPVTERTEPEPTLREVYRTLRSSTDALVATMLDATTGGDR
jgi:xylulokinase